MIHEYLGGVLLTSLCAAGQGGFWVCFGSAAKRDTFVAGWKAAAALPPNAFVGFPHAPPQQARSLYDQIAAMAVVFTGGPKQDGDALADAVKDGRAVLLTYMRSSWVEGYNPTAGTCRVVMVVGLGWPSDAAPEVKRRRAFYVRSNPGEAAALFKR